MTPVSVLILTKNEAEVVGRAIASVRTIAEDVLVVDSESTDDTVAIARGLGARVVIQKWLGWLPQKAVGLENCRHDWVLSLDADEIVTPKLARSVEVMKASGPDPDDGYVLERRDEFRGRLMPNMTRRSKRRTYVRLFNKTRSGWDPAFQIHELVLCPGRLIPLEGTLLHWRNHTVGQQVETFNAYSDLEAKLIVEERRYKPLHLIAKPVLRFVWIYVARGHWRMGMHGFVWAGLHATAEFLRHAKSWELARTAPTPHPPGEDGPSAPPRADSVSVP